MDHRPQRVDWMVAALVMIVAAGVGFRLSYSQSIPSVGYAIITPDAGMAVPAGSALFSYANASGVLVSQAAVAATVPTRSGRIVVDEAGAQTAIALVNPSAQAAAATLILRDSNGNEVNRRPQPLGARQHIARFVREMFPDMAPAFAGSLSFESDQSLAAVTLRQSRNRYGEALYATLPVVDLTVASTSDSFTLPQIAVGDGYTTQVILINRSNQRMRGQIRLLASSGQPLLARLSGTTVAEVGYDIAAQGIFKAELEGISGLGVGYAVVTPMAGDPAPGGAAVFRYRAGGQLVTEAGVMAAPMATTARIFVDQIGTRTGIAIANPGTQTATLTLSLMDRGANAENSVTRTLAAGTHMALFADELFPNLDSGFTGLMEIRSNVSIAPVTLKLIVNTRGDLVLTTLPVADPAKTTTDTSVVFPQIAIGSGFSTRFILLNGDTANASTGTLRFLTEEGSTWMLPMAAQTGSQFPYQLSAGGGRQYLPGNSAAVAAIRMIDRATNEPASEVTINEGDTARLPLRTIDNTGKVRDDFDISITSIDPEVASVNADGSIQGKRAGFATLTLSAGGFVSTTTATVVHLDSAPSGYAVTGIAQDLSRRLYLAATDDHTVLLAQTLMDTPGVYAGITQSAGHKDDIRLQSQFRNPAFLALNLGDGSLYVSDRANHVIRRVRPGNNGRVETLAGTETPGNRDGTIQQAQFNNPQGIALDNHGNLWVADSGNHTIRRIRLATGEVETIAGAPMVSGSADGIGAAARFSSPAGIAVDVENPLEQSARERRGEPAPIIHVIVADTGNNRLRRVYENGLVETIQISNTSPLSTPGFEKGATGVAGLPVIIDRPTEVSVDSVQNVYVTEAGRGRVRVILRQGAVSTLGSEGTFRQPTGVVTDNSGKVIVGDSGRALNEVTYGAPRIKNIAPALISSRGGNIVTVNGSNFAPDTFVIVGTTTVNARVETTGRLFFTAPAGLLNGNTILTVQNRGGIGQTSIRVDAVPLSSLRPGEITTVAGGRTFAGEGGQALTVSLDPRGVAVDSKGNLYVSDYENHRVRRIDPRTGIATTLAGNGRIENSNTGIGTGPGDNGPAIAAAIGYPQGLAIDKRGNLLIADGLGRIRKVDLQTGIITTIAGIGFVDYSGDNGPATSAAIGDPVEIVLDRSGNLFISDAYNNRVRRVDAVSGIITTVAGNGTRLSSGDGGLALEAGLSPGPIAVGNDGSLYIADLWSSTIRRVDTTGHITTLAGAALGVALGGVASDAEGNLFIADIFSSDPAIRRVDAQTGTVTRVASNGSTDFFVDGFGNIWISDRRTNTVQKVNARTGRIEVVAGSGTGIPLGDGDRAVFARLYYPGQMAFGPDGSLLIADSWNQRVRKVDARTGIISTVAGGEVSPPLNLIFGTTSDKTGNVYFSEGSRVRRLSSTGSLSVFAGTGVYGFSGDGGPATSAQLARPTHLAVDGSGNLFIVDHDNFRIRKVDARTGVITTVAKHDSTYASDITVDSSGNVFFDDEYRIRKIDAVTGVITTAADLPGIAAIALDRAGTIFFSDYWNVYRIDSSGRARIIAGQYREGLSGDGGPATAALLNFPQGLAFDADGNLYIADTFNDTIRVIRGPIP